MVVLNECLWIPYNAGRNFGLQKKWQNLAPNSAAQILPLNITVNTKVVDKIMENNWNILFLAHNNRNNNNIWHYHKFLRFFFLHFDSTIYFLTGQPVRPWWHKRKPLIPPKVTVTDRVDLDPDPEHPRLQCPPKRDDDRSAENKRKKVKWVVIVLYLIILKSIMPGIHMALSDLPDWLFLNYKASKYVDRGFLRR